jgi:hypothetical protein
MRVVRSRRVSFLAVALLATACGSSGGPAGGSAIVRVVAQGEFVNLPPAGEDFAAAANAVFVTVFDNPVSGDNVSASVQWTSSDNRMEAVFFQGNCTAEQVVADACRAEGFQTARLVNGRTLQIFGANPGTYTLAIINLGPGPESGTYTVDLVLPTSGTPY